MESLGSLGAQLPPNEQAEAQLGNAFRQAALSLTSLFKQGKRATTKAYLAGQKQAFQEVLEFVQASLDQPHPSSVAGAGGFAAQSGGSPSAGGLDAARLINFICARQEALTAEEEDNDDDEPSPAASTSALPPRRAASAAPAPPSPLRPGVLSRAASAQPPPVARPASAAPQHRAQHHSHHPVASTSSAPASPPSSTFSPPFTRPSLFTNSAPSHDPTRPSSHSFGQPASPSPFSASSQPYGFSNPPPSISFSAAVPTSGGPPSPLSRPPSHHRALRSRNSSRGAGTGGAGHKSGTTTPVGAPPEGAADEVDLSAGMKRRWAHAAVAGAGGAAVDVTSGAHGDERVISLDTGGGAAGAAGGDGMDVEPMAGMESWDGVGERPCKRVTRAARGAQQEPQPGEGSEQR
ncbi:hypothetical protein JCM10207_005275 [Rhodosporidiobolus poonsookiae]